MKLDFDERHREISIGLITRSLPRNEAINSLKIYSFQDNLFLTTPQQAAEWFIKCSRLSICRKPEKHSENLSMKLVLTLALLFISVTAAAPLHASKPSFDCSKAEHEAEELICKDDELAALDRNLTDLYKALYKNTPASEQKLLKAEQIGWVKGRNDCWKADDQYACVKDAYEVRITELKDR
ncbi:MAG: lysozyme inhibitor LprI family protein [Candidatus Competibacteraceae bacterium]|jgi:uncharacterized protein YecT (DUF1311 family)|nr:lysozyme inhibitor LprI family protein [Candidatus Competibacteraceae bacterium]